MAPSIHPNSVSLKPSMQDMESAFQAFVKRLENKSSDRPATTSRPDLMPLTSHPMASSTPQNSVSVNSIIQDMAASQSFLRELKNVSSGYPEITSRPWGRDYPTPDTTDLMEHETLAMAFTKLMAIDDPFRNFRPRLDAWIPTKPCYLFGIPRELRDMITDNAVSSGYIGILQTSKQLYDEGIGFLYKRRIFHIDISLTRHVPRFNLQEPVAALIQNVNLEIALERGMRFSHWIYNSNPLHRFNGLTVRRQTCRVLLLIKCLDLGDKRRMPWLINEHLKRLVGFSRMILEVRCHDQLSTRELEIWPRWQTAMVEGARENLCCALGPGVLQNAVGPDCGYLEFHPRKHLEANLRASTRPVQHHID